MGAYIKGMEMPESCWECRLDYDHRYCMVTNSRIMANGTKADWCPLVPVNTPHGRLIDADSLLSERMKSKYYHLKNGDVAVPVIDIEHAPTVIDKEVD